MTVMQKQQNLFSFVKPFRVLLSNMLTNILDPKDEASSCVIVRVLDKKNNMNLTFLKLIIFYLRVLLIPGIFFDFRTTEKHEAIHKFC